MKTKEKFSGYKVAFGCFLIMFVHLGVLQSMGVFLPHLSNDLNIPMSQASLVVTFATTSAFLCSLVATRVISKLTPKWTLLMATLICAGHYVLFSFTTGVAVVWLGGVLGGFVMGFGTNVVAAGIISEWFIEKRATVLGAVFGGAGFGGAITILIAGYLIEQFGWRTSYLILAAAILVIGLSVNFLLIKTPEELNQKPLGWEKEEAKISEAQEGVTYDEAKKSTTFKLWWVALALAAMLYGSYTSFGPTFWQSEGMSHIQSSNYISLLALLGAGLAMISGSLADKFGEKLYVMYPIISFIIGTVLLILFPNSSSLITIVTIVLIAISYPTSAAYPATITPAGFGNKDYAKIQGQLMAATYFGKALYPIILGQSDKFTGSMKTGFIILIVFGLIAMALFLLGFKKAPIKNT